MRVEAHTSVPDVTVRTVELLTRALTRPCGRAVRPVVVVVDAPDPERLAAVAVDPLGCARTSDSHFSGHVCDGTGKAAFDQPPATFEGQRRVAMNHPRQRASGSIAAAVSAASASASVSGRSSSLTRSGLELPRNPWRTLVAIEASIGGWNGSSASSARSRARYLPSPMVRWAT